MVRLKGLEPSHRFQCYHLKVVRLPIPPQPQSIDDISRRKHVEATECLANALRSPQVTERLGERKRQFDQRPRTERDAAFREHLRRPR
jgi:hypothetical protein